MHASTANDFLTVHTFLMVIALIAFFLYGVRAAIPKIDLVGVGLFLWLLAVLLWRF
jgi:hypothetical protein